MHQRERRLPRHQDQLAPLLERHVGGALDERAAGAGRDRGDGAHRAGTDHHAVRALGARRRQGAPIVVGKECHRRPVAAGGRAKPVERVDAALVPQQAHAVARRDQPDRHLLARQDVEQAHPVRRTRGAGQREHDRVARHARLSRSRSSSANANTVTDMTPFIVKNAASSRDRSPGRTSRCSYSRIPARPPARRNTTPRIPRPSRTAPAPGW